MTADGQLARNRGFVTGLSDPNMGIARGLVTPNAGSFTVDTGLESVIAAFANLEGAPSAGAGEPLFATAVVGDQAGTPAAGSILIKSWQDDATAASSGFEAVSWLAIGPLKKG